MCIGFPDIHRLFHQDRTLEDAWLLRTGQWTQCKENSQQRNFQMAIRPYGWPCFHSCPAANRRPLWKSQLSCSGLVMTSAEAKSYINRISGWSSWQNEVWFTEVGSIRDDRGTDDPYKVQIKENPGAITNPKRNWSWVLFCPNSNYSVSREHSPSTNISSFYWAWHQTRFPHSTLCYAQAPRRN